MESDDPISSAINILKTRMGGGAAGRGDEDEEARKKFRIFGAHWNRKRCGLGRPAKPVWGLSLEIGSLFALTKLCSQLLTKRGESSFARIASWSDVAANSICIESATVNSTVARRLRCKKLYVSRFIFSHSSSFFFMILQEVLLARKKLF